MTASTTPARSEDAIQRDIVAYLELVLPDTVVHANANAARRNAGGRAANAVPGLRPGIPDLTVCLGIPCVYFEVKKPGGRLSAVQIAVIARLTGIGARVEVVTSIDDVRAALRNWGIRTREAPPTAVPNLLSTGPVLAAEVVPA